MIKLALKTWTGISLASNIMTYPIAGQTNLKMARRYLTQDSTITFNEATEEVHYGQEIFEGLKAYRRKDGGINLFRPDQNAKRMANSAKRLLTEPYPEDEFIKAVKEVVLATKILFLLMVQVVRFTFVHL